MEDKNNREQLYGLSSQLMELFVADVFSKHKIDIDEAKQRMTVEQREGLKQTVEQLKTQVDDFLASKAVRKVTDSQEKTDGQAPHPLRDAFLQKKQQKENKKQQE
ncbi:hypothetical protein M3193_15720 [Sporosarcina luteola]|uniref:hypothetical protein n=1 Tax=Sporosarcina luteola TaxID=582850 RepID=UPI0020418D24|nr:hypothetical protein [Sporosarcina luteola]MCM3745576.1 hypothetical protein [Sporosarcina luteola]